MTRWMSFLITVLLLGLVACDGGGDDNNPDAGNGCLEPTFTSIYENTLSDDRTCAGAGCHDAVTTGGGQDYTMGKAAVHATLLGDTMNATGQGDYPKRVVPSDPDNSFFWIKLTRDDAPDGRMPLAQAPLKQCDLDAIRTWIANGAAND